MRRKIKITDLIKLKRLYQTRITIIDLTLCEIQVMRTKKDENLDKNEKDKDKDKGMRTLAMSV